MIRLPLKSLVILAALGAAAPALAQEAPKQPTKQQAEDASFYLSVMMSALSSKEVDEAIKNQLFACIYENPFFKISEALDKTIASSAGKIEKRNPTQVLGVMAGVCGYKPTPSKAKPGQSPGR